MIRAKADQLRAMLDTEMTKCRDDWADEVPMHDVPAAFSVLACQHRFAEASKTEVTEAKDTIVNYLALRLQKTIGPQLQQQVYEWVTGPDDGPEPDLGTPDVVGFLRELRSMFRLEDKVLEARAAYWGLLPLVCLEQIVNCQELKQEHRSLLTMYYMALLLVFRTNKRTCTGQDTSAGRRTIGTCCCGTRR